MDNQHQKIDISKINTTKANDNAKMNTAIQLNDTKLNDTKLKNVTAMSTLNGKHLIADFYHCQCDMTVLCHAETLVNILKDKVSEVGLTVVGEAVHEFKQDIAQPQEQSSGVTISLLLAESHVCLHTWGEFKSVTLDVYVCNYLKDNSEKAESILNYCKDLFKPKECDIKEIIRVHNKCS